MVVRSFFVVGPSVGNLVVWSLGCLVIWSVFWPIGWREVHFVVWLICQFLSFVCGTLVSLLVGVAVSWSLDGRFLVAPSVESLIGDQSVIQLVGPSVCL